MVSKYERRESRARHGLRALTCEMLICAAVTSGCSSRTIRSGGADGSKKTASGGTPSADPSSSAGDPGLAGTAGSGGGQASAGSHGSGGSFDAGGLTQGSGGSFGAGGFRQGSGGAPFPSGKGGAAVGSGGSAGTSGDAGHRIPEYSLEPVIPPVTGDCPKFLDGTISFMGLDGIRIAAGTPPSEVRAPMLFYWHGTGSTSDEYMNMAAPVAAGIIQAGGVIVSFRGTTGGDLYSGTSIFGVGDLTLTDQLVACAVRDAHIDPRRIYTTGCSAGGLFSTAMAALRSSYIAAASPNSGGFTVEPPFQNAHTPALMTVHEPMGINAGILDFASTSAAADKAFKVRGGFVIDCNTGAGTCGGAGLAGDVWNFFVAHPFGVDPEPWSAALPASFSSLCKIQ
jgi:hypothetical protein